MKDITDSVTKNNRVNHANWARRLIDRAYRGEPVSKDSLKQARAVLAHVRCSPATS